MNVHELFTALSQQDRKAKVTVEGGKIHVGGEVLKIGKGKEKEPEAEAVKPEIE
mgnify:CR=1 FL=1